MKTRYALKALAHLAAGGAGSVMLVSDLAEREGIPRKFLEAILRELRLHGILSSQRGRGGGYSLRADPSETTLATVIRALEGPIAPLPCLSRTAYRKCDECRSESACGVRVVLRELDQAMREVLDGTTLADLVRKTSEASSPPVLRYAI